MAGAETSLHFVLADFRESTPINSSQQPIFGEPVTACFATVCAWRCNPAIDWQRSVVVWDFYGPRDRHEKLTSNSVSFNGFVIRIGEFGKPGAGGRQVDWPVQRAGLGAEPGFSAKPAPIRHNKIWPDQYSWLVARGPANITDAELFAFPMVCREKNN